MKLAFLFAGQGAQTPGMGCGLYEVSPAAHAIFDRAEALRPGTIRQCFHGTAEELAVTINTQPCLFTMDLACAAALQEAGYDADVTAGFSLGEVAALVSAGLLPFEEAFALVCRRAELMQAAAEAHPGAMDAVLRLSADAVETLSAQYRGIYPVNYNCPGQTVVSGDPEELPAFEAAVAAARGRAMRLPVGGAFHSPLMAEAAAGLADYTAALSFREPRIPLYANVGNAFYTADTAGALLSRQVMTPVYWQRIIEEMIRDGVTHFIELGAGKTLTGFLAKIDGSQTALRVEDPDTLAATVAALEDRNK